MIVGGVATTGVFQWKVPVPMIFWQDQVRPRVQLDGVWTQAEPGLSTTVCFDDDRSDLRILGWPA